MIPQEKAKELVEKYCTLEIVPGYEIPKEPAKLCALIVVNEIILERKRIVEQIKSTPKVRVVDQREEFWEDVKKEIEKL